MTYRSYSNGKVYKFKKGKEIAGGAYGKVGEIEGRPDFVYKEVTLTPKRGEWVRMSRENRIKGLYRELWALHHLNLLEGYLHEGDSIFIIMPKLKGSVEKTMIPNPNFNPNDPLGGGGGPNMEDASVPLNLDRAEASLKGFMNINRKGIYHVDPHPGNCLIFDEDGKLKANIIDYGLAEEPTYLTFLSQWFMFFATRPGFGGDHTRIEKARKEFNDQHQFADYATMGFYMIAGIGVVSVFGFSSFLLWQFLRTVVERQVIRELTVLLDRLDIGYTSFKDTATTDAEKTTFRIRKGLINLGYILINAYTLRNLYLYVPDMKVIANLSQYMEAISRCDNGTLLQLAQNIVDKGVVPAINGMMELIKNQQYVALDEMLAEITYLYMQMGIMAKSFATMLEKVPPEDCLLKAMDVKYTYNPALVFAYAKTKTKELFYHSKEISKEDLVEKMMKEKSKAETKMNVSKDDLEANVKLFA